MRFQSVSQAQAAMKTLHQSRTLEGSNGALVVKYADTDRDKSYKHMMQVGAILSAFVCVSVSACERMCASRTDTSTTCICAVMCV